MLSKFKVTTKLKHQKQAQVAGCVCDSGVLEKNQLFRVRRRGDVIYDGNSIIRHRHIQVICTCIMVLADTSNLNGIVCSTVTLDFKRYVQHTKSNILYYTAGPCLSMKYQRDEVPIVKMDSECGLIFDIEYEPSDGDVIECYSLKDKPRELIWDLRF